MAHLLRFLVAAALGPFAFAATVYSDDTFDLSDWTVTFPLSHAETSLTLSQAGPDSNPYFLASYLVSERSAPSPTLTTITTAFQNAFVWDPQTDGALTNLEFSLDFRNISTSFPTNPRGLSWAPAFLQNGTLYINSTGFVQPLTSPGFQNMVWNLTPASAFIRWAGPTASLNLSESGQPITFGFAVGLLSGCGDGQLLRLARRCRAWQRSPRTFYVRAGCAWTGCCAYVSQYRRKSYGAAAAG